MVPLDMGTDGLLHARKTDDARLIREGVWNVGSVSVPITHEAAEHLRAVVQSMLEWRAMYSVSEGPFCSQPKDLERSTC